MYFKGTKKLKLYKIVPLNPEEMELKIESMLGKEDKILFIYRRKVQKRLWI